MGRSAQPQKFRSSFGYKECRIRFPSGRVRAMCAEEGRNRVEMTLDARKNHVPIYGAGRTVSFRIRSARLIAHADCLSLLKRRVLEMASSSEYVPPKVWTWNKSNGGRFANINRPISGPTHDKELPVGNHPLRLYSLGTPNGVKVRVRLEELLALGHGGAEYDAWLIKISDGFVEHDEVIEILAESSQ